MRRVLSGLIHYRWITQRVWQFVIIRRQGASGRGESEQTLIRCLIFRPARSNPQPRHSPR